VRTLSALESSICGTEMLASCSHTTICWRIPASTVVKAIPSYSTSITSTRRQSRRMSPGSSGGRILWGWLRRYQSVRLDARMITGEKPLAIWGTRAGWRRANTIPVTRGS